MGSSSIFFANGIGAWGCAETQEKAIEKLIEAGGRPQLRCYEVMYGFVPGGVDRYEVNNGTIRIFPKKEGVEVKWTRIFSNQAQTLTQIAESFNQEFEYVLSMASDLENAIDSLCNHGPYEEMFNVELLQEACDIQLVNLIESIKISKNK